MSGPGNLAQLIAHSVRLIFRSRSSWSAREGWRMSLVVLATLNPVICLRIQPMTVRRTSTAVHERTRGVTLSGRCPVELSSAGNACLTRHSEN